MYQYEKKRTPFALAQIGGEGIEDTGSREQPLQIFSLKSVKNKNTFDK